MDDFLQSVCDKHGLNTVCVMLQATVRLNPFYAYVHWGDGECAGGSGKTINEAIECALAEMRERPSTRRDGPVLREGVGNV